MSEIVSENFYNDHATQLAALYLSKSFEQVHSAWLEQLPPILNKPDARILDLGAGAGRDSKYFVQQGATVLNLLRKPVSIIVSGQINHCKKSMP